MEVVSRDDHLNNVTSQRTRKTKTHVQALATSFALISNANPMSEVMVEDEKMTLEEGQ